MVFQSLYHRERGDKLSLMENFVLAYLRDTEAPRLLSRITLSGSPM